MKTVLDDLVQPIAHGLRRLDAGLLSHGHQQPRQEYADHRHEDRAQLDEVLNRLGLDVRKMRNKDIRKALAEVEKPDDVDVSAVSRGEYLSRPHTRRRVSPSGRSSVAGYVLGQVEFFPLRLAWSSTVHKSQGLSLDRCQVDFRDNFFAHPAMLYVALSRCRTLAGLRLVGQREIFVRACQMDARVKEWI